MALSHLATCSERTLALRLPPQSVHGASLNTQGAHLARQVTTSPSPLRDEAHMAHGNGQRVTRPTWPTAMVKG